jgi:hypothetical protein
MSLRATSRLFITVGVILLGFCRVSSGQTPASNYWHCLNGWADCRRSALTPQELTQVEQSALRRNYQHCLNGWADCRKELLAQNEQQEVEVAALRRNYQHCLNGWADCREDRLGPEQKTEVYRAALRRNYQHCVNGWADCRREILSGDAAKQVEESAYRRNYQHCVNGWADCRASVLTSEEQTKVTEAELRRNYQHCSNGWQDCRLSLLTAEQKLAVAEAAYHRNYQHCLNGWPDCDRSKLARAPADVAAASVASSRQTAQSNEKVVTAPTARPDTQVAENALEADGSRRRALSGSIRPAPDDLERRAPLRKVESEASVPVGKSSEPVRNNQSPPTPAKPAVNSGTQEQDDSGFWWFVAFVAGLFSLIRWIWKRQIGPTRSAAASSSRSTQSLPYQERVQSIRTIPVVATKSDLRITLFTTDRTRTAQVSVPENLTLRELLALCKIKWALPESAAFAVRDTKRDLHLDIRESLAAAGVSTGAELELSTLV